MNKMHKGDFRGKDIQRLLNHFRSRLEDSRKRYLLTDNDRSAAAELKTILHGFKDKKPAQQPTPQQALDQAWACLRRHLDAGGLVLNYTGIDNPYNIVNLAWSGTTRMPSKDGQLTMDINEAFIKGHLTYQGPEYDPMPALDIEQGLHSSYFQTDVFANEEIDKLDDYLEVMKPYGIEDWMATIIDQCGHYRLVALPFFYQRVEERERHRIRGLMEYAAPVLAEIFEWIGFSGSASIGQMLTERPADTGTILLDLFGTPDGKRRPGRATYDHAAITLLREHLNHTDSVDDLIRRMGREIGNFDLIQGYRNVSELPVFKEALEAEAKVDYLKDRQIMRIVLRSKWELNDLQRNWIRVNVGKPPVSPRVYWGRPGGALHYKTRNFKHSLRRHLVENGNVVAIGTQADPLVLVAEPVNGKTVWAAMRSKRLEPLSVTAFRNLFSRAREDLTDPEARIFLYDDKGDDKGIFAILQKARSHRLFDEFRKFVQEYDS